MESVYEAVGGIAGLRRLAEAWHRRVLSDDVVSHAFSHGFRADHTERLAAYWSEALGGPALYRDAGADETEVLRVHSGHGPHEEMDRRAIECFDVALTDVGLAEDSALRRMLHDYFAQTTGSFARFPDSADQVPTGLPTARWSWDGPVG